MNRPPLDLATLHVRTLGNAVLRDDLLRLFREHGPLSLDKLTAAVEQRDADAVVAAAHRLKGSAATIAAATLADITRRMEMAATDGEWLTIAAESVAARAELQRCLQQIEVLLRASNQPG